MGLEVLGPLGQRSLRELLVEDGDQRVTVGDEPAEGVEARILEELLTADCRRDVRPVARRLEPEQPEPVAVARLVAAEERVVERPLQAGLGTI